MYIAHHANMTPLSGYVRSYSWIKW